MQSLPAALLPLGAWSQFVTWVASPDPNKPGKLKKFPTSWMTGDVVDAHVAAFWTSALTAIAMAPTQNRGSGSGAGFVVTDADPYFFLDIDGAYDPVTGQWSSVAVDICNRLSGAAVEVSMSGTGLHIIGRCAKPVDHNCKNTPKGLELYTRARFVALTGINAVGNADHDCTAALAGVIADYFPKTATGDWADWTVEAVEGYTGPADDDALIAKAVAAGTRHAAAVFAADITFSDLWTGNVDALARKWPSTTGKAYDMSSADMALANQLAFWTGKNCERMQTLMERSALKRDKWYVRPTYLSDTILQACAFVQKVYSSAPGPKPLMAPATVEEMLAAASKTGRKLRDAGREFMGPVEQLDYFAGCFYDNTSDRVYSLPKNTEFKKGAFDVNYGGHMFILDPAAQKSTDSAWEAFTRSRVNIPPIVDALCFRPELPAGELVNDGSRVYANSYVPYTPRLVEGDPGKFLRHLEKMLPDANDRAQLIAYMAAVKQYPGRKFQWWPVIQGVEGNGKSLIGAVMTYAIGQEYTHAPNAHAMARDGNKFNGWIYRKLLVIVEEICLTTKRDFLDEFKVIVTNERIPIERKGQDQINGDNRANGFLFTNYKDGVPISVDTRRYGIFYTAQQEPEDLARCGMTASYFADLWDWIYGREEYAHLGANYGAAVVSNYLQSYAIPDALNPAGLSSRAPVTTSTAEALVVSLGRVEQEILDAIDEGRVGFAGGWVSSKYLDQLLEQIRAPIPRGKRRGVMKALGYDYHPALREGRVNDTVLPDNAKPRLYVKEGHEALGCIVPHMVAKLYSQAQEPGTSRETAAVVLAFNPPRVLTAPSTQTTG